MLVEQQIAERRERAAAAITKVLERPHGEPYGDYRVKSASGKTYRVAMRGPGLFENYCSCPDFAVNTLGTCKHIEALLVRLGKRYGRTLGSRKFARAHASISLQYGDTIAVRLRLPADPSPALRKLAEAYFDPAGLLRQEHFQSFHQVIEVFRQADLDAVIYSDVLEYLDRENELAEGLDLERQLLAPCRVFIFCPAGADDERDEQVLAMIGIDGCNTGQTGCSIHFIQAVQQWEDLSVVHPLRA